MSHSQIRDTFLDTFIQSLMNARRLRIISFILGISRSGFILSITG
ncbi:hypothetical protein AB02_4269 [Escherichia coli 2-222-05_S1_C1]|nr:hypothetical protein AB02_4269 [Escherichia coli 2-222-05_S1_C1]KDX77045.1 hypothetical protein AB63_4328 [Escherichia coli 2-222-05_S1_C3]QIC01465.1 Hypothetical protein pB28_00115 [Escherichia coli O25b:H4-ST131]WBW59013.1 hypothetical protein [Escherichia coli]